jgi:hypothetical protein
MSCAFYRRVTVNLSEITIFVLSYIFLANIISQKAAKANAENV